MPTPWNLVSGKLKVTVLSSVDTVHSNGILLVAGAFRTRRPVMWIMENLHSLHRGI